MALLEPISLSITCPTDHRELDTPPLSTAKRRARAKRIDN